MKFFCAILLTAATILPAAAEPTDPSMDNQSAAALEYRYQHEREVYPYYAAPSRQVVVPVRPLRHRPRRIYLHGRYVDPVVRRGW